jgi:Rrf2 family nitric oxide-sensitive transcriptional repressor
MRLELTRRGDYAVRAMLALAASEDRLSATTIARRMSIPAGFLSQVMRDLVASGLVNALPGRAGGYRPARDPAGISVLDVIEAVEGDSRRRTCVLRNAPCGRDGHCDVHHVFAAAQDALLAELAGTTLGQLASEARATRAVGP